MIKKKEFNQKDKKVWEDYIKDPSDIYDKEKDISNNTQRRERYKFDLHGFTLDEANNKVKEIIENCVKNKFKEILLVTGKGIHSTSDDDAYISKSLGKGAGTASELVKSALTSPDTKTALGTYIAAQASGAQNLQQRATGAIMNPNMELLFKDPSLRPFNFTFKIIKNNT